MRKIFNNIYLGKKVLVTGHTGFKGSWLKIWLKNLGATVYGYSLSPNTEPSHYNLTTPIAGFSYIADIRDKELLEKAIIDIQPDIVFHLAAQPLVRQSYANPIETFHTNIIGTVNLFEAIRRVGKGVKAIVNVTTDKVYKIHEDESVFKESDVLGGYDPYSTSKACVELVHESYRNSFFKELNILSASARAGNVIGGGDWALDRLIPDVMVATSKKNPSDIRNPLSIRPWQHVLDPLSGYLLLGQLMLENSTLVDTAWNFGPNISNCLQVNEVLNLAQKFWGLIRWNDVSESDTLHETKILRLDCSKANNEIGWQPVWDIEKAIRKTVNWYKEYYTSGRILTFDDLNEYILEAQERKMIWTL